MISFVTRPSRRKLDSCLFGSYLVLRKKRGAGSLGYAEAMLIAYNRKCRYTLRMTKLHSGTITTEDDFVEENEEQLEKDPVLEE